MTSMLEARGAQFVTKWTRTIPRQTGLSVQHLAQALQRADITTEADHTRISNDLLFERPVPEIEGLEPEQAQRVIAEMRAIHAEIKAAEQTHCHYCGLPKRNGQCQECD